MAFFGITIETISKIESIPNADKIQVASLNGLDFSFVIKKDQFKIGDRVLYFPIDSVINDKTLEVLGLKDRLSGPNKNRLKTITLRGQISQGIVANIDLIPNDMVERNNSQEITDFLGVTKYESPDISCKDGNLKSLPSELSIYDIESADRHIDIINNLMNKDVVVTEKMEGSNFSVLAYPDSEKPIMVNQRRFTIEKKAESESEHDFWRVANIWISNWARKLAMEFNNYVAIYGEFVGPGYQGNIYNFKNHKVLIFDIKIGNKWMDSIDFLETCDRISKETGLNINEIRVPVIFKGKLQDFLGNQTVKEISNGKSLFNNVAREGIVIKPYREEMAANFGRVIIKQRSPLYLAKSDA